MAHAAKRKLHHRLLWLIEQELDRLASLERANSKAELDGIRVNAPNSIPGPFMRTLWRLLLTGRVKSPWRDLELYGWKKRLVREGLTVTLRLQLRELLTPMIVVKKPIRWDELDQENVTLERLKQLVDWELVLSADHVHSSLRDLVDARWQDALVILLADLQQLLLDALDLLRELGEASDFSDRSYWDLPSISPHGRTGDSETGSR